MQLLEIIRLCLKLTGGLARHIASEMHVHSLSTGILEKSSECMILPSHAFISIIVSYALNLAQLSSSVCQKNVGKAAKHPSMVVVVHDLAR